MRSYFCDTHRCPAKFCLLPRILNNQKMSIERFLRSESHSNHIPRPNSDIFKWLLSSLPRTAPWVANPPRGDLLLWAVVVGKMMCWQLISPFSPLENSRTIARCMYVFQMIFFHFRARTYQSGYPQDRVPNDHQHASVHPRDLIHFVPFCNCHFSFLSQFSSIDNSCTLANGLTLSLVWVS